MKKTAAKLFSAGVCTVAALAAFTGCGNSSGTRNLMDSVNTAVPGSNAPTGGSPAAAGSAGSLPAADAVACTDFAVRLFRECSRSQSDGNILVSPLSVVNALAMTAGGTRGETLEQMEKLFGADLSSLCSYLYTYNETLPAAEKYKLYSANSLWIRDDQRFTVHPDFLETNAQWFNADVYLSPFDGSTLRDINGWVSDNTDEMIPEILDEIPEDAVMYLLNALAFDAEWQSVYNEYQIREGIFTREDGTTQNAEMMYSTEYTYLQDTQAQGFIKYYQDAKYAFAALLPDEGVNLEDYIAALTGKRLHELLSNPGNPTVEAAIPKFEAEYSAFLNDILKNLGMTDAFDSEAADLSGLGTSLNGNLYISNIIHKTYIAVDEKGTKAGAAAAIQVSDECAIEPPADIKTVYLNRPFVYMIIDCEEKLPIFIGMVTSLEQ